MDGNGMRTPWWTTGTRLAARMVLGGVAGLLVLASACASTDGGQDPSAVDRTVTTGPGEFCSAFTALINESGPAGAIRLLDVMARSAPAAIEQEVATFVEAYRDVAEAASAVGSEPSPDEIVAFRASLPPEGLEAMDGIGALHGEALTGTLPMATEVTGPLAVLAAHARSGCP